MFITLKPCVESIARDIRAHDSGIRIVVGGAYPSSMPELVADPNIDVAVLGEGESTFRMLLERDFQRLGEIAGIAFTENGNIVNTGLPAPLPIDNIAYPTEEVADVVDADHYCRQFVEAIKKRFGFRLPSFPGRRQLLLFILSRLYCGHFAYPSVNIVTSRGCPHNCTFCAVKNVWGRKYRLRSAHNVLEEIDYWVRTHSVRQFVIHDDNFAVNKDRVIEISRGIVARRYRLRFIANSGLHVNTVDGEVALHLKRMGFEGISLGIESGSQRVLDEIIHKKIDLGGTGDVIAKAKEVGLRVQGFFIVGFPGETKEERRETIDFIKTSGLDDARLYVCQPFPGSRLYAEAQQSGSLAPEYDPVNTLVTDSTNFFITSQAEQREFHDFITSARQELKAAGLFHGHVDLS